MPFPLSFRGAFRVPPLGEHPAYAMVVSDRIERAVRRLGARDVERHDSSLVFVGPSAWAVARSNPLMIVARGEINVVGESTGRVAAVHYSFRTTKGLGVLVAIATVVELYARLLDGPRFPLLALPGVLAFAWGVNYIVAWIRVPLLLMRAATGELESRIQGADRGVDPDAGR